MTKLPSITGREVLIIKLGVVILITLGSVTYGSVATQLNQRLEDSSLRYQRRYGAASVVCQNVHEIVFVGFFPCRRNGRSEYSDFNASDKMDDCDLLAEAAAYLAVERVNEDPTILPNITLKLRPVYTTDDQICESEDSEVFYNILMQFSDILLSNDSNIVWGVIGPHDNVAVGEELFQFTANSGLVTVTYGLRDTRFDQYIPTLYRTLPSDITSNLARIVLLDSHKWLRIATLASEEHCYFQERTNFLMMFDIFLDLLGLNGIQLGLSRTFEDLPESALHDIKSRDINIIVGFFGPDKARTVLCKADTMGLVSESHAWILPSYFDPNWWKLSSEGDESDSDSSACSNEDMRYILESVIFINNIKVPPTDFTLKDFQSQIINKALDLFPSLTEESLKPYLLRSRATSAYDAITLLAKSVGVAFSQGGDSCTDTRIVQKALEDVFMECEFCRLYSECFLNETTSTQCQHQCSDNYIPQVGPGYFKEVFTELNNFTELRSDEIINRYGQVLYSQFLDGEECPILLWWPIMSKEYNRSYIHIDELDDPSNCIARRLNLSRKSFVSNESNCPTTFLWRDSLNPPSSNFLQVSYVSVGGMVSIGLLVLVGEVIAVSLLILNIVMRKNRNVKASSPWLNIILIFGGIIRVPSPLYFSLILSANSYDVLKERDLTPLCYIFAWQYYMGGSLFVAVLVAKNWRIYRIFHNRGLRMRGYTLSDGWLVLQAILITIPVVIVLIAVSATGINFTGIEVQDHDLKIVNITACYNGKLTIYYSVAGSYLIVIFLSLTILVVLTSKIPVSLFHREHLATYRAIAIALVPSSMFTLAQAILLAIDITLSHSYALLWLEVGWTVLGISLLITVLLPAIYYGISDKVNEKRKSIAEEKEQSKLTEYKEHLKHEADSLRSKLQQITMDIEKLKTHSLSVEHQDKAESDTELSQKQ